MPRKCLAGCVEAHGIGRQHPHPGVQGRTGGMSSSMYIGTQDCCGSWARVWGPQLCIAGNLNAICQSGLLSS